ncbi:MAG: guanylate kinase [Sarcina sp.]
MGKIFCILGKSGAGKDTIFSSLKKEKKLNLIPIIGYTTRPMRKNETNGVEYFFIDNDKLKEYEQSGKIIEVRCYDTINGRWYYSTIDDGQIILENNNYIFIATLEAYKSLINYFGVDVVVPLYIALDDGERLSRALDREQKQLKPNYSEMCRRFLADEEDFSDYNLKKCNINKVYENYDLNICIEKIKRDIKNYLI